jgi:hypothetical protein
MRLIVATGYVWLLVAHGTDGSEGLDGARCGEIRLTPLRAAIPGGLATGAGPERRLPASPAEATPTQGAILKAFQTKPTQHLIATLFE